MSVNSSVLSFFSFSFNRGNNWSNVMFVFVGVFMIVFVVHFFCCCNTVIGKYEKVSSCSKFICVACVRKEDKE